MTRSSEPLRSPADALGGPESLRQPQRSSHERSAASREALLRLRRECDSGKCLRHDRPRNVVAGPNSGLEDGSLAFLECSGSRDPGASGGSVVSRLNGEKARSAVSSLDVPSLKGILSNV